MAEATSHSDNAKTLVEKVTAGEYQNPEEFKSDSDAVIAKLGETLDTMDRFCF